MAAAGYIFNSAADAAKDSSAVATETSLDGLVGDTLAGVAAQAGAALSAGLFVMAPSTTATADLDEVPTAIFRVVGPDELAQIVVTGQYAPALCGWARNNSG